MKELIIEKLKELETTRNIKILFCVESGSRVWRMDSADSDYDVRFVYYRPSLDYLKLNKPDEVITGTYDKSGNLCNPEVTYLDFVGFDIYKFVRLLIHSNPTAIEWLISDIVYFGAQPIELVNYAITNFNRLALYHHYKSMAKQNYLKYIKSGDSINYKKYLYSMRGVANAEIVEKYHILPPINFNLAISQFNYSVLTPIISDELKQIITLKKTGHEKDIVQSNTRLDEYIETFLKKNTELLNNKIYNKNTELVLEKFIIRTIIN